MQKGWMDPYASRAAGNIDIVKWLHAKNPQMIHIGQITPLHIAAFSEQTEIVKLFLNEIKNNIPLIEEIVYRSCPKTLTLLLENGLNPNLTNKFQQTLLHLAAYKGQVVNLEILLEHKASINAQDLSKKTPLYLATVQGHLSAVKYLLEKKADPAICGVEGDTILHVAAFYGHTPLVQLLLHHLHVNLLDDDGKQPIHKAVWGDPKPDVVKLLLEKEADPNAINAFGYTPLHWAAKHGHIASAELLIKAGAKLDIANQNHDLPFDLAIRWGQDELIHFFLGKETIKSEELPKDVEGYYSKKLIEAKREKLVHEQIFYLEKLSDLYLQKKNWAQAARLLNGALAILEKDLDNPQFKTYLLARLERLEALFLESQKIKVSYQHRGTVLNYRSWLKNIRDPLYPTIQGGSAYSRDSCNAYPFL